MKLNTVEYVEYVEWIWMDQTQESVWQLEKLMKASPKVKLTELDAQIRTLIALIEYICPALCPNPRLY
jgi:hypothetical protein